MRCLLKIFFVLVFLAAAQGANAAKYDIKKMTPEVQQALESRRSRFEQLQALKTQGAIGENNRGYVEVLSGDSAARALVESENRDRKMIYQTIAVQNGLENQLSLIEEVFAQVQRDKAATGDQIQEADGRWVRK